VQRDVVVVGAGTAGAAAALACAARGLSVLVLERGPLDRAGARWVNGVPGWAFDEAGIARPVGEELHGSGQAFHLVAGWGPRRVVLRGHDVLDVDMRHLVERLQRLARDAGAELRGGVRVQRFDGDVLHTSEGDVRARWLVDASGLAGARLLARPALARTDLCAAAQQVHRIADRAAADAFLADHDVSEGETLCFAGIAGGYSIVNVTVRRDTVGILTGSVPAEGHPSGQRLLDDFVAREAWIGARLFGGSRAVPLRLPYTRLYQGRVALVGDAGCQVFSAHGSGIGAGMVAGRMLADALAAGRGVEGYSRDWWRRYGAQYVLYDLFRRFSQQLSARGVERLMSLGVLSESRLLAGLEQRWPIGRA